VNEQPAIVKDLCEHLAQSTVVTDPVLLESYRHDNSPFDASSLPTAVVLPRSTAEVATVLRAASRRGVPVVTRGAGTGLAGGASSTAGCVVLSTRRLDQVIEIDPTDRIAPVQPGVITGELRARVKDRGLFYPPDPGSVDFCTIGGNVATNPVACAASSTASPGIMCLPSRGFLPTGESFTLAGAAARA